MSLVTQATLLCIHQLSDSARQGQEGFIFSGGLLGSKASALYQVNVTEPMQIIDVLASCHACQVPLYRVM